MAHDPWSPERYDRFQRERRQPFFDLVELVRRRPGLRVVDLGCGTGALTHYLHLQLQARETLGLDSSAGMLAKSAGYAAPGLRFERGDIAAWRPAAPWDLVFSNAALHWVPHHEALLARLTEALAPDGQLAVQVPANFDHPSHTVAVEVAGEAPFREALEGALRPRSGVLTAEAYAALLARLGYREQHVRLQVYGHWLGATADVVSWVQGTLLTDYERRLPPELYGRFVARYRERLLAALGDARPYFFAFKRILLWGLRASAS
jgi:trans-aconitate 2-methyltransferase